MSNPNANKLLDMLKSAATPPASTPQPTIQHPTGAPSLLSLPTTTSGSPREPSPAPPPPSLQAVSLSDLFAGLTSPPTVAAPATASQPKAENHQANLLGMLKGISTAPSPNPSSTGPALGAGKERTVSGSSSPFASATAGSEKSLNGGEHKTNMLNMLKSPLSDGGGLPQPVVAHRTGGSASSGSALPSPSRASHIVSPPPVQSGQPGAPINGATPQDEPIPSVPTPPAPPSNRPTPPPAAAPATVVSPPVPAASAAQQSRSMFDFVSPFDVFEKPKPKQQPQEKKEAPAPAPMPFSATKSNGTTTVTPPVASPVPSAQAKVTPGPPTQPTKPAQAPLGVKNEPRSRQASASGQASDGKKDLGLPWLNGKVVEKGAQGRGPRDGTKDITIDLSKPSLDSLINAPGAVQVTPMTILRADNPSFSKGRSVATTSTWVAYVLSKGRVRLIDSNSGSRLVLQIPCVTSGMALDIAAIADSIALVGPDHSISVFKVPEHWDKDEPATELITYISGAQPDVEGVGSPNRVEWVRKDGGSFLAIGGDSGVIIVKPDQLNGERDLTIGHLESQNKVLKTEGPLAAFCLNHSHQAIGLVSAKSHFTLYNVSSLGRVWHRILPASQSKPSAPSSVHFVESNVLVGRDNNTQFDLVQLTVDIAVLTTIKFVSPSPSLAHLHFAHAAYDPNRTTLWIAPFSRGSVYGLRYALKGQPQIKVSERPDAVVFDKIAEYPLDSVTGLVVNAKTPEDDAELFFATPNGFSLAQIEAFSMDDTPRAVEGSVPPPAAGPVSRNGTPAAQSASAAATPPAPAVEVKKEKVEGKRAGKAQRNATPSKGNSPAVVKQELPSVAQPLAAPAELTPSDSGELKRLVEEHFAQLNGRIDALRAGDFAADVSNKVEKSLKASLASAVQADLKRSLTATITTSVQNEVKSALTASAPQAVSAALAGFPKDMERALAPLIQRTVGSVVQTSVDRALDGVLQSTLLPAISASSARVADQLSAEFKSEMVQIRKDFTHSRQETPRNDDTLRTLVSLVTDLQRQVQVLSERAAAPPPPPAQHRSVAPPSQALQPPHQSQPPQPGAAGGSRLPFTARAVEDHFMTVLTASSTPATLHLVDEHHYYTEDLLPSPPGKSPLSQPLLLTLSHRLSVALAELSQARPGDTRIAVVANWLKRLSHLVDVRNPDVSAYYGKVVPIVLGVLEGAAQRVAGEPAGRYVVGDLREAAETFGSKL